jgi:peptidoglycan-associated lipoprotein
VVADPLISFPRKEWNMKFNVAWWKSMAVVGVMGAFLVGCGGDKPAPETDVSTTPPASDTGSTEETPPVRADETTQWVDPNTEYASILKPIRFEYNKYRITEESKPALEGISRLLSQNGTWKVLVEGHCDERGTNEYNLTLGEQRAQATKRYLVSLGVDESRLETVSYGEERPASMGHDEAAWAENRRAEFKVEAPRS